MAKSTISTAIFNSCLYVYQFKQTYPRRSYNTHVIGLHTGKSKIAMIKMAIEIDDLAIEHSDFP